MRIQTKTLLAVGATLAVLIMVVQFSASTYLIGYVEMVQDKDVDDAIGRVEQTMAKSIRDLEATALDWAAWDDTYRFIADNNTDYVDSNLQPISILNLDIDFMFFFDTNGILVNGVRADGTTQELSYPSPEAVEALLAHPVLLEHGRVDSIVSGMVCMAGHENLVASRPIVQSSGEGPIAGTLVLVRCLTEARLEAMAGELGTPLRVYPYAGPLQPDEAAIRDGLDSSPFHMTNVNETIAAAYFEVRDLYGEPSALFRLELTRTAYMMNAESQTRLFALILIVGLVLSAVVISTIHLGVLSRLGRLRRDVEDISRKGDPSLRVRAKGGDEISELADDINGLLTSMEKASREVREGERRYHAVMDQSSDAILLVNVSTKQIIEANRAFSRLLGGMEDATLYDLMTIDHEAVDAMVTMAASPAGRSVGRQTYRRADGSLVEVEVGASLIHLEGKEALCLIARDVSEQVASEKVRESLLKSMTDINERMAVTLRSITEGVVTVDLTGTILMMNQAAEALTGWTEAEAGGRPVMEVVDLRDADSEDRPNASWPPFVEGEDPERRGYLVRRDGKRAMVEAVRAPLADLQGTPIGAVLVLRDVSERVRNEEILLTNQKLEAIGTLAGGIAHDFNNYLTAVLGRIALAKTTLDPSGEAYGHLAEAERTALQTQGLTHELLTFSAGGAPIRHAASITELLRDTIEFTLSGSSVRCRLEVPEDIWPVEIDPGQVSRVFTNLVLNAAEASPVGGEIAVTASNVEDGGRFVKVSVADRGEGISKDNLSRIFDPYFTTKVKGTGLGLPIVRSIVKAHQGRIEVASLEGEGTIFEVFLPASSSPLPDRPQDEGAAAAGGGRVLLMDDEDAVLSVTSEILHHLGYEVVETRDGEEAIAAYRDALAKGRRFDIVIMDLTIPGGMGGREAIVKLRELDPGVRAIVSSGYSDSPVMADHRAHGFAGVVPKPYRIAELSSTIQAVMREGIAP